jgi:hypothetical protein
MRRVSAATDLLPMKCDGRCGCAGCEDVADANVGPATCFECGHDVAAEEVVMKTATKLEALSKAALRKHLLATPTIADRAWAPARGVPARNEGETRTAYIKRVLK